jgi:hypothetical protein
MADRKLRTSVFVRPKDGEGAWYHAGDTVPAELASTITNPRVWADDEADESTADNKATAKAPAKKAARPAAPAE